jgi:Ca-activated chloride channel family protein
MGLVIFSGVAVTRCPLTLDKHMLEELLKNTTIETIPLEGTVLSEAIIVAANRLKKSSALSRIMIVLTDGAPSPNDKNPLIAVELAKKLGIKIYTIGIGSPEGGWFFNNFFGWQQHRTQYNEQLLEYFANETGGSSFIARNPEELEKIYDTIDQLERTEHDMPVYARYKEYFIYFLGAAALLLAFELLLTTLLWVRL